MSSVLLAGGEDVLPIFLTGEVTDTGIGRLVAIYPDSIVTVSAVELNDHEARYETQVHPFADVTELNNGAQRRLHSGFSNADTVGPLRS